MLTTAHRNFALMGTSEIENLQRALINLGVATQRPAVTCKITGIMDDATMMAINAGLGLLTEELPNWLYVGVQGVMIFGSTNATAKKYTGEYATQIAMAANAAAVKFKVNPPVPVVVPLAPTVVGFFAPGWYKTPLGLLLIGAALLVGYKFFIAPTKA
jgi:hypothetical protein